MTLFRGSNISVMEFERQKVSSGLHDFSQYLNITEASTVSICPFISKSSNPFTYPFRIVPSVPITTGITVIFMFHSLKRK